MNKKINFLGVLFIILFVGFLSYLWLSQNNKETDQLSLDEDNDNLNLNEATLVPELSCDIDSDCLRSTVSNDPILQPYKYSGYLNFQPDQEQRIRIDIACISTNYFNQNTLEYNLSDQVNQQYESHCNCVEKQCKEEVYGAPAQY